MGVAPVHPARSIVLFCLFLGTISSPGGAQGRLTLSQYHHTAWSAREGAPTNINSLAQSDDGFLWLGTPVGLFRFDGMRFEQFERVGESPFPSGNISALLKAPEGLWIGYRLGGVSLLTKDTLESFGVEKGLPERSVWSLTRDSSGTMWAGTTVGLYHLERGRWREFGPDQGVPRAWVSSLITDARGRIWAATTEGIVRRDSAAGRFTFVHPVHSSPPGEPHNLPFLALGKGNDEFMWLSSWQNGLQQLDMKSGRVSAQADFPHHGKTYLFVDPHGDLWVAGSDSADPSLEAVEHFRTDSSGQTPVRADAVRLSRAGGLSGNEVLAFFGD